MLIKDSNQQISILAGDGGSIANELKSEIYNCVLHADLESEPAFQQAVGQSVLSMSSAQQPQWSIFFVLIQAGPVPSVEKNLTLDLVKEIAYQIGSYEQRRVTENQGRIQNELLKITQLIKNLGLAENSDNLIQVFVNDLLAISKASRISFVMPSGKIKAISSVSVFSTRTRLTRSISKIGRLSARLNQTMTWPAQNVDDEPEVVFWPRHRNSSRIWNVNSVCWCP